MFVCTHVYMFAKNFVSLVLVRVCTHVHVFSVSSVPVHICTRSRIRWHAALRPWQANVCAVFVFLCNRVHVHMSMYAHVYTCSFLIQIHRGRIADDARPHRHQFGDLRGLHSWNAKRQRMVRGSGLGSIATFAVCLPSMTLMILVARYIARLKGNPLVSGAMRGLRPVVIGMIGAAALLLMFPQDAGDASFIDFWSWILFGGVLAGSYFKLNPILLIVLSAAAGIAIYL